MTLLQFMSESPLLTFFLALIATNTLFKMWNRMMRCLNIRKHGWPPEHCDADGDFKPEPDADDDDSENASDQLPPNERPDFTSSADGG